MAIFRHTENISSISDKPVTLIANQVIREYPENLVHTAKSNLITHVLVFRLPFPFPVVD